MSPAIKKLRDAASLAQKIAVCEWLGVLMWPNEKS